MFVKQDGYVRERLRRTREGQGPATRGRRPARHRGQGSGGDRAGSSAKSRKRGRLRACVSHALLRHGLLPPCLTGANVMLFIKLGSRCRACVTAQRNVPATVSSSAVRARTCWQGHLPWARGGRAAAAGQGYMLLRVWGEQRASEGERPTGHRAACMRGSTGASCLDCCLRAAGSAVVRPYRCPDQLRQLIVQQARMGATR